MSLTDLSVRELPLFPLPDVVLFPQEVLPLHIFEARYKIMLQSILNSDRRFGVVRWNPHTQEMASVGCCAEILQTQTEENGCSNIVTIGQQRFRILNIVRESPFRSAMVSWVEDEPVDNQKSLDELCQSVTTALHDVVSLTGKLTGTTATLPDDLPDLPRELSFWIGAHLGGPATDEQQALLELTDTHQRLNREYDMLDHSRRQLAARTVLKDTLSNADQTNS